jgi:hypothetical protein
MQNSAKTAVGHPPHPLDGLQLTRLQQAVEGLNSEQLAWASGYLAGLGAVQPTAGRAANRLPQERFGDFVTRRGLVKPVIDPAEDTHDIE